MPPTIERVLMNRITGDLRVGVRFGRWWVVTNGVGTRMRWGFVSDDMVKLYAEELGEL